ncbi:MAG: polyphosphate polymerase domain-containing protein [Verrucomicrobiota bacterium]
MKYLIPNALAVQVREFVRQHLELDEFGGGPPHYSYPVHSLYLDTNDWRIYWRTINGDKNRFKLRIRYYNENNKTPIFWEIKRRMKDVILKQRCGIRRQAATKVVSGQLPAPAEMFMPDDVSEQAAIQEFFRLQFSLGAVPKLHVAYDREAYVSAHNNEFRVTFDRHVRVATRFDGLLTTHSENPFVCTGSGDRPEDVVILELKFTERFPDWYNELVQAFNLMQTGAAKYVEGTFMYAGRKLPAQDVIRNMVM